MAAAISAMPGWSPRARRQRTRSLSASQTSGRVAQPRHATWGRSATTTAPTTTATPSTKTALPALSLLRGRAARAHDVKRRGHKAGVNDVHPHLLRHTCATAWISELKLNLHEVQLLMGHARLTDDAAVPARFRADARRQVPIVQLRPASPAKQCPGETMPARHQLTTEERRRGALAAAAVKRRKRQAADKVVAERRADKKLNRQRNWEAPGYPPLPVYPPRREPSPALAPAALYGRSCPQHGVFNCGTCG
jgi:hypothetical protein